MSHALSEITLHPLHGTGIGNYTNTVAIHHRLIYPIWYYQPVHVVFLLIFAEIGAIGVILFSTFLLLSIHTSLLHNKLSFAQFVLISSITTIILLSCTDHWPYTNHNGFLFFCMIITLLHIQKKHGVLHTVL